MSTKKKEREHFYTHNIKVLSEIIETIFLLIFLQSLSDGDGVNGDGELVDHNDDHEHDGEGDASEDQEPTSDGSPKAREDDVSGGGNSVDGHRSSSEVLPGVVGNAVAESLGASGNVVGGGVVKSEESEKGDEESSEDDRGHDDEGDAENVHAEPEEEAVADGAGEAEGKENTGEASDEEGQEDEGLDELKDGPDRGGRIVGSIGNGLDTTGGLDAGGKSVEGPEQLGGVKGNVRGRSGGAELVVLRVRVPIDDEGGDGDGEDGESQQSGDAVKTGELHLERERNGRRERGGEVGWKKKEERGGGCETGGENS